MAVHYHVHSSIPGYLCDCDDHYPYRTLKEARAALAAEKREWQDFGAQGDKPLRITGSLRSGAFDIEDPDSIAWYRRASLWECDEPVCLTAEE